MKAKIHVATIGDRKVYLYALTKTGAARDALESLREEVHVTLATGEQIYEAGKAGVQILFEDKYRQVVDPNQQDLPLAVDGPITATEIEQSLAKRRAAAAALAGDA